MDFESELDARSVHNPHDRNYSHPEIARMMTKTAEELAAINDVEFRARFRERLHHTLELPIYHRIVSGKPLSPRQGDIMDVFVRAWHEKGLPEDLPEYRNYLTLLDLAQKIWAGEEPDLAAWKPHALSGSDVAAFEHVLFDRRSIRQWDLSRRVSDETIDKILLAGLWAPHSCNLRSIRYLVVREENEPGLFLGSNIPTGPVHLVVMQDLRVYDANPPMPPRNQLLDCGAATQNILLAAHAYGLAGVWITFCDRVRSRLKERFDLPEHIRLVNFVDVGWPAPGIYPCPPSRPDLEETILGRI